MSYNGSGTFVINTAGQPVVSGTVISSTAFNALTADLATGLSTAITKDGQTTPTANIPMGNNKITGLAVGTAATDAANLSQVQSTAAKLVNSVSGADTITGTMSPNLGAYATGQMFYFVAVGANTGAVTINIDSLGAKSITRDGTTALAAGDIQSGEVCVIVYDGTQFQLVNGASQSASIVTENLTVNKATVLNESGGDNDTRIEGDTDANLFFADASTDRIGIGTNAPDAPLHIAKSSATSGVVINAQNSTTGSLIQFACPGVANVRFGAPNADAFVWQTFGSGSYPERMRLTAAGELCVATSTPILNSSNRGNITIGGSASSLLFLGTGTTTGTYLYHDQSNSNVEFWNGANGAIIFGTNNTSRARITSGGNLLVGATALSGVAGTFESTQTGSGAVGAAILANASNASYGYYVLASRTTRAATSETSQYIAWSNDGSDTEFNLRGDGNGYADGTWNNNGADYAEYFESASGGALTVGATVVLDGNKVREATASDPVSAIIGVVRPKEPSKASMVVGNTAWNKWANKYLTDDFDRYIMEDHDVVEWTDADGKAHSYESQNIPDGVTVPADAVRKTHDDKGNKFQHYKLNPAWDKDAEYTPREKRDEWIIVGLVGQVKVLKGKPMNDRWIKMRDVSAAVEEWMIR